MSRNPLLVLGIGNPILSDDAIGIIAVREIQQRNIPGVDVEELSASGIEVMEVMLDRKKIVIVDAIMLPDRRPGEIFILKEEDFIKTVHASSPHGINLPTAIALGRQTASKRMPEEIVFIAMQAENIDTFSDRLSPAIEEKIMELVDTVERELRRDSNK